jgi:hypothetical protein
MPTIPIVSARVRAYLADFGAIAVAITERVKIKITDDPSGCYVAWWLAAKDAERLRAACKARGDVEACARILHIKITPHEVALMKADAALARLDRILTAAKANGDMKTFNRAYRARRAAAGGHYMSYTVAEQRLRQELSKCIAAGSRGDGFELALSSVFEDPGTKTNPQSD